jgi:cytochrome c biogenesis protein CcmG/thiol:disulfide interchange protein DsbE
MIPLAVVPVLALLAYGFRTDPRDIPSPLVGKPASPFMLTAFDGQPVALASLRGQVVVVNFWASWCEPCKSEAPRFQQAYRRYGNRVAFVGVDTADYSADAGRFLSRYGVTYPNVRDPDRTVLGKYGGLPIPRTFVISPKWQVTGYIFGEARSEDIDSAIQKALGA